MSTADVPAPQVRLLGRFTLAYGRTPVDVGTGAQRLLAYLGLRHHGSRTVVAGTLWPEVTEERAQGSLRTALWRLHRGRREPLVRSEGDTLSLTETVTVDVRALLDSALHVVGTPPPALRSVRGTRPRRNPAAHDHLAAMAADELEALRRIT